MKLTRNLINNCRTDKGGFTAVTLNAFGVAWPSVKGWSRRLIGAEITSENYKAALAGRHVYGQKISKRSFGAQKGGV